MKYQFENILALFVLLFLVKCSSEYQDVKIIIEDFRFRPSLVHLYAEQPIRLTIKNQGHESHKFEGKFFPSPQINVLRKPGSVFYEIEEVRLLPPGESIEVVLFLPPGSFNFRCPIRGHRGMNGMLVVEEAGS